MTPFQSDLLQARLFLQDGHSNEALDLLNTMHTDDQDQHRQVLYLLGWTFTLRKQWSEAAQALGECLQMEDLQATGEKLPERERMVRSLMLLGEAAWSLGFYDEADRHLRACQKVLHDRRIHMPEARIHISCRLGEICLRRGVSGPAALFFKEARRQSRYYQSEGELGRISFGLCRAYASSYEHFADAKKAGLEALRLSREQENREMEARVQHLLGTVSLRRFDYPEASDHFTESLAIATSLSILPLVMMNCLGLVDVCIAQGRMEEAERYCQFSMEEAERHNEKRFLGPVYRAMGDVLSKQAEQKPLGNARASLLALAASWYQRAIREAAAEEKAEALARLAQIEEEQGNAAEALELLRQALHARKA